MPSTKLRRGRRSLLVTAAVIVSAIVLAVAAAWVTGQFSSDQAPTPAAATPKPSSSAAGASGCVAGQTVTVDSLLTAQRKTPMTTIGAVSFAGAFQQFTAYAPTPEPEDLRRAFEATTAGDLHTQEMAAVEKYASNPVGAYGDDNEHRLSLKEGRYFIESAGAEQVVVTLAGKMMTGDKPQLSDDGKQVFSIVTLTLTPSDAGWTVTRGQVAARTWAELQSIGTTFSGGC